MSTHRSTGAPAKGSAVWEARPRWRLVRDGRIALGPGKADLLEAIDATGSISAAAQSLGMSYRRGRGAGAPPDAPGSNPPPGPPPRPRRRARPTPPRGPAL